jgi:hypothetical protein
MDAQDADLSAGARVSVSHHNCAAFVAGGVERRTGRMQRVRDGEVAATYEPEERLDPTLGQRSPDRFSDLHRYHLSRCL